MEMKATRLRSIGQHNYRGQVGEDDIEGLVLEGECRHIGCVQLDTLGHSATAFRYVALTPKLSRPGGVQRRRRCRFLWCDVAR